jgi:hypothetical protein
MADELTSALRHAVYRLLKPLVRILLRHGMAYGTFAELARKAYTDEGLRHLEALGKRPSVSAVSALTGLTRKEAKRVHELDIDAGSDRTRRYNRAIRVVSGWLVDPRFRDGAGEPAALALEGQHSFAELVKDYSGDIPPSAMLTILEASNTAAVEEGRVILRERAYLPTQTPVEHIEILGRDVGELVSTIGHNISSEKARRVFQRKVSNNSVRESALPAFRALSNQQSQALLETYHQWLTEHQVDPDDADDRARYVAIGIYYYDDEIDEDPEP